LPEYRFAGNYQRTTSRSPQESWGAKGPASERTANSPAVLSLFLAVFFAKNEIAKAPLSQDRASTSNIPVRSLQDLDDIKIDGLLSIRQMLVLH
jgi:hypothetical protein